MRKSDQPLEPSIEEILASIRKIIADDSVQGRDDESQPLVADAAPELPPRPSSQPAFFAHYQEKRGFEPFAPAEPAGEDDIIELTEDIILEDQSGQSNPQFTEFAPQTADHFDYQAAEEDAAADRQRQNAKLEDVFSNLAAEVERLSHGHGLKAEPAEQADSDDWDEPAHVRQAVETYTAAASVRPQTKPAPGPAAEIEPAPLPAPRVGPADPAPRGPAPPARPQSRPVWSARHLDGEGPRSRRTKDAADAPAAPVEATAARQQVSAPRDNWADGVQMPVPETGPTVPFAAAPDDELMPDLDPASAPPSAIEKEKDYVGGVLTRVFGRSQKKEEEPAPAAAPPASKAEKLAKTTISEFAAEKLRAPAVAEALQADKPFMEAITGSLESALANIEFGGTKSAAPNEPAKDEPMMEAQPAPYEELPDALLPFDSELAPFSPGQIPGFLKDSIAARQQPAPVAPAAERPVPAPESRAKAVDALAVPEKPKAAPLLREDPAPAEAPLPPAPPARAAAPQPEAAALQSMMPTGLEDSIKELIKPLIIQWLNDNLPRIVENAVRDELSEQGGLTGFRREGAVRR